jgi:MFS family permease
LIGLAVGALHGRADTAQSARGAHKEDRQVASRDRAPWILAGALFFSLFFLWGVGYDCFPIVLPSMIKQFHLSKEQAGWVPAVQAITAGVFGLFVGWMLDRAQAQIVMGIGAVLTAVGIVMMARAGSFNGLIAGSVVTGIGMCGSTILPATMVISNWFGERRGTALGVTTAGMEFGGMVITFVAGYLIAAYNWRFAYSVLAAPLVVIVLPLYLIFIRTRPSSSASPDISSKASVAETTRTLPGLEVSEAVWTRAFWMLVVLQFCYTFVVGGSFVHLVQYLIGLGYTRAIGTMVVSLSLGLALIGKPAMGALGDRIGGKNALALCLLIGGLNMFLLLSARDFGALIAFTVIAGITGPAPIALGPMVQVETLGLKRYGSIAGLIGIPFTLGAALGPPIIGHIADLNGGSYSLAFEVCMLVGLVGATAAYLCAAPGHARIGVLAQAK